MTNTTSPGIVRNCGTTGTDGNNLDLPGTVTDALEGVPLKQVNQVLLEYARDVALLQSRAFDAVLKIISAPAEG